VRIFLPFIFANRVHSGFPKKAVARPGAALAPACFDSVVGNTFAPALRKRTSRVQTLLASDVRTDYCNPDGMTPQLAKIDHAIFEERARSSLS
jgi:hypothetical protein